MTRSPSSDRSSRVRSRRALRRANRMSSPSSPAAPASSAATSASACSSAATRCSRSTTSRPATAGTSRTSQGHRRFTLVDTTSSSRCPRPRAARRASTTWPARPARPTTSAPGADDADQRDSAPGTCWTLAERIGARLLQASTSEVYGDPQVHPQTESYWGHVNPIGPRSCYDEGKRCAEALCFAYHRERAVPIRVARIFNTYGPRLLPGRRPRGQQLHRAGAARRAAHRVRRRPADAQLLLRRRHRRRPAAADGQRRERAGQPRQPGRAHRARARRAGAAADRQPHRGWSAVRCRPTIRAGAAPTSARRGVSSTGSRASSLDEGLERTIAYFRNLLGLARTQTTVMPATERVS